MHRERSGLLAGKRGVILGVANKRSIAWGIARAAQREGARIAITYQGERLRESAEKLIDGMEGAIALECDVTQDSHMDRCFEQLKEQFGGLDFLVHAIAFANKDELEGEFLSTSREGFRTALDISTYSLTALAQRAAPLMEGNGADGGSILTLSYLGGQRVVPHYNVMGVAKAALESSVRYLAADLGKRGVRVNAISAGPIRTLAASGISDFPSMLQMFADKAPLKRNIDIDDVGDAALFYLSRLSRAVTGEVTYVDCGFHILGL
jgi:enoyl-[acyl-carrier protein] reductase I